MGWLAAGLLAACGAIPAMADGTRAHPTPRGYDGESLVPWSTLPTNGAFYSNFMEYDGKTWFFGTHMSIGSDPIIPDHPISISYSDPAVPRTIYNLLYHMTLTRFEYLNTNSSRDITIPDVYWNLHGAEEGRGYSGPLQYIPSSVFNGSDITSVTIPYTLLALQEPCFLNCRDLKSIKIVWGWATEVTGDDRWDYTDTRYRSQDGVLYNKDMTRLIKCPEGKTGRFTIPGSVTELSPYAFANSQLEELTIPDNVTVIPSTAFSGALAGGRGPVSVRLGNGIKELPSFRGCSNLVSVTLGTGITSIPDYAFYGCTSLKSVVMPDSVTNIGEYAFACGDGLTVAIPESVRGVAGTAFEGSRNLTVVAGNNVLGEYKWDEELEDWVGNVWGEDLWHFNASLFNDCEGFSLVVSTNVTRIGAETFGECAALTSLTIPESVTEIGEGAFGDCTGLTELVLPGSVVRIGDLDNYGTSGAFANCTGLTELLLPHGLREIGPYTFAGCVNVTNIFLPNTLTVVGADEYGSGGSAFEGCGANGLSVTIEAGTTQIWASAFSGCGLASLDQISIPSSVKGIGDYAFYGCPALETAAVPDGVESIGYQAFAWCEALADLVLPDSLREIGSSAFQGCAVLGTVEFGSGLESLESYAFQWCTGLESMELPAGLSSLESYVFDGCSGLVSVVLPAGMETVFPEAFDGCTALERIEVAAGNAAYASRDGVLFGADGRQLVLYPPGRLAAVYALPDGVESLGARAFNGCPYLVTVSVPASVTDLGCGDACAWQMPFDGCTALAAVEVAEGNPAYRSSDGVLFGKPGEGGDTPLLLHPAARGGRSYAIPAGTTRIGAFAFAGCTGLEQVEIPEGVTDIGYRAFEGSGLTALSTPKSVVRIADGAFAFCANLAAATIAAGQVGHGSPWDGDYADYAFEYCTALEAVTLGPGVTEVSQYAFSGSGVRKLFVPSSWKGAADTPVGHVFYDDGGRWPEEHPLEIVYYEVPTETETQTTPVPVTHSWLEEKAADILAANGGDFEAAAKARAANGMPVWKCYLAGLSTTEAEAEFKVKSLSVVDGEVQIEWEPDLNEDGTKAERRYVVEGKPSMGGEWGEKTPESRFFRVKVRMPEP